MRFRSYTLFPFCRYGVGYHLTLVKSPNFEEERIVSLIREQVPTAKMAGNVAAELSYILNEDSTKQFKPLFEKLEGIQIFVIFFINDVYLFIYTVESQLFEPRRRKENGSNNREFE